MLRRLAQAAAAFALAVALLLGQAPRRAQVDGKTMALQHAGTPCFVLSTSSAPFGLSAVGSTSAPTFADLDGDGDLDANVGETDGNLNYFENTGTAVAPGFVLSTSSAPFGLTDVGNDSAPAFADLDGDGDLDAIVGENNGNLYLFLRAHHLHYLPLVLRN